MFVGEIRKFTNQGVANIGGKDHQPSDIVTVRWIWRDDSGKSHEYLVNDALFFSTISHQHSQRDMFCTTTE